MTPSDTRATMHARRIRFIIALANAGYEAYPLTNLSALDYSADLDGQPLSRKNLLLAADRRRRQHVTDTPGHSPFWCETCYLV